MIKPTIYPGITHITPDEDNTPVLTNVQSALDLMATAKYEYNSSKLIFDHTAIMEGFFDLSTKIAGEILQKYQNYLVQIAIVGDFSKYISKSLQDFIYECNQGNTIYFTDTLEDALAKLSV